MNYFNDNCMQDFQDEYLTPQIIEQLCDKYFPPQNKNPKGKCLVQEN